MGGARAMPDNSIAPLQSRLDDITKNGDYLAMFTRLQGNLKAAVGDAIVHQKVCPVTRTQLTESQCKADPSKIWLANKCESINFRKNLVKGKGMGGAASVIAIESALAIYEKNLEAGVDCNSAGLKDWQPAGLLCDDPATIDSKKITYGAFEDSGPAFSGMATVAPEERFGYVIVDAGNVQNFAAFIVYQSFSSYQDGKVSHAQLFSYQGEGVPSDRFDPLWQPITAQPVKIDNNAEGTLFSTNPLVKTRYLMIKASYDDSYGPFTYLGFRALKAFGI